MAEEKTYPYATHLNVLYAHLERIDVQAFAEACTDRWYNQTLTRVNDAVMRLGVTQGEERSVVLMVEAAGVVPTGD